MEEKFMNHSKSMMKSRCSYVFGFTLFLILSCMSCSKLYAVNIYTKKGPSIHFKDSNNLYLYFTGHNNDFIWVASYNFSGGTWSSHDRIINAHGNVARTTERPAPFSVNKVFFHGNIANNYIWSVNRPTSSSDWLKPVILKYNPTTDQTVTEPFQIKSSPVVMRMSWSIPNLLSVPSIFYTDLLSGRLSVSIEREPGSSVWFRPRQLPPECVSNVGPAVAVHGGAPVVFYANKNTSAIYAAVKESQDVTRDDWVITGIPRAFTVVEPCAVNFGTMASLNNGILLVYKGHNNNKIWLRMYRFGSGNITDSRNWKRLGYVAGIETDQAPAISYKNDRFYLAFKIPDVDAWHPKFDVDIGYLDIDENNRQDSAGHTFTSFR
jgi:hypothetical protein